MSDFTPRPLASASRDESHAWDSPRGQLQPQEQAPPSERVPPPNRPHPAGRRPTWELESPSPWSRPSVSITPDQAPLVIPALAFASGIVAVRHVWTPLWKLLGWGPSPTPFVMITAVIFVASMLFASIPIRMTGRLRIRRQRIRGQLNRGQAAAVADGANALWPRLLLISIPFLLGTITVLPSFGSHDALGKNTGLATLPPGPHDLRLVVSSAPRLERSRHSGLSWKFDAEIGGSTQVAPTRIPCTLVATRTVARGDRLHVRTSLNPERSRLRIDPSHVLQHEPSWSALAAADRLRARNIVALRRRFPTRASAWWIALLLGDRVFLDPETVPLVRRVGQSHLLAISGMHVGVLATLLLWPFRRSLRLRPVLAMLLLGIFLIGFAAVAGSQAAVVRASFFGVLLILAVLRGRRHDLANGLALGLLGLGTWWGRRCLEPGFVLSFSAVAGIAFFGPSLDDRPQLRPRGMRWKRKMSRTLHVSVAAWLGASATLVHWTPDTVLWGPLFTLALMPLLLPTLTTGLAALVLPASPFDRVLEPVATPCIRAFLDLCTRLDALPGTALEWPTGSPWVMTFALVSAGLRLARHSHRLSRLSLLLAIAASLSPSPAPHLKLMDLGRGQALFVHSREVTILYDAGSLDRSDGGARGIRTELWRSGRSRINLLVLSHPHLDHVGAVPDLLVDSRIDRVMIGPRFDSTPLGVSLLTLIRRHRIPVIVAKSGDSFRIGDLWIRILHPSLHYPEILPLSLNNDSLVIHCVGPGLDLVATGDLEFAGRAQLSIPRRVSFWLLPHHGRDSLGLSSWLDRLDGALFAASTRGSPRSAIEELRADGRAEGGRVRKVRETAREGTIHVRLRTPRAR